MAMSLGTSSGKKLSNTVGFVYRDHCPENSDCKVALVNKSHWECSMNEKCVTTHTHTHTHTHVRLCVLTYMEARGQHELLASITFLPCLLRGLSQRMASQQVLGILPCLSAGVTSAHWSSVLSWVLGSRLGPSGLCCKALYQLSRLPSPHQLSFNDWPLTHSESISWKPTMCQVLCWVLNNPLGSEHQTVVSPGTGNMQRKCLCILHHTNTHESHILKCP